jgi:hypothetical protein
MQNYFDNEIKNIERELLALKTASTVSSIPLELIQHSVQISIPLQLSIYQTTATGAVAYKIVSDEDLIVYPYLSWYYENIYDIEVTGEHRYLRMMNLFQDGAPLIFINARGSENDIQRMIGGESITLTATLTVVATRNFTMEKVYGK